MNVRKIGSIKTNKTPESIVNVPVSKIRLYVAFYYVKPGDDGAFKRAAETSLSGYKAHQKKLIPISTAKDFKAAWALLNNLATERVGVFQSIHIFSHASKDVGASDGLEFMPDSSEDGTVTESEIGKLDFLVWSPERPTLTLHGCNTGLKGKQNKCLAEIFALSQKRVTVCGQKGYAYFSKKEGEYEEIDATTQKIYLYAYSRRRNAPLGDGLKMSTACFVNQGS